MKEPARKLPDTNVILRYLLQDNAGHYKIVNELFEMVRVGDEEAVILESVLVECVYVLTKFYKVPKEEASAKLTGLLHYKGVINDDKEELIEALTFFTEKNIDIVDCILCVKAKSRNLSLFSFDERLKKLYNQSSFVKG